MKTRNGTNLTSIENRTILFQQCFTVTLISKIKLLKNHDLKTNFFCVIELINYIVTCFIEFFFIFDFKLTDLICFK